MQCDVAAHAYHVRSKHVFRDSSTMQTQFLERSSRVAARVAASLLSQSTTAPLCRSPLHVLTSSIISGVLDFLTRWTSSSTFLTSTHPSLLSSVSSSCSHVMMQHLRHQDSVARLHRQHSTCMLTTAQVQRCRSTVSVHDRPLAVHIGLILAGGHVSAQHHQCLNQRNTVQLPEVGSRCRLAQT